MIGGSGFFRASRRPFVSRNPVKVYGARFSWEAATDQFPGALETALDPAEAIAVDAAHEDHELGGAALDQSTDALERLAVSGQLDGPQRSDFATIRRRGRGIQFASDGRTLRLEPVAAQIPFGTEADGSMLSDHLGFVVRYRLTKRPVRLM